MKKASRSIVLLILTIWACNTSTQQTVLNTTTKAELFNKPIEQFELTSELFTLSNTQAQTIETSSGTRILIPDSAFENLDGSPVLNNVQLSYKEACTPAEIILSGITMDYEQDGTTYPFQTAGMFELKATAQNKELKLREGKVLNVTMLSNRAGDFNFYRLDETDAKAWTLLGKADAKPQQKEMTPAQALARIEELKKITKPSNYNASQDHLIDMEIDYQQLPELKVYKSLLWKFVSEPSAELEAKLAKYRWTSVSVQPATSNKGNYLLTLQRNDIKETVLIAPILVSKDAALAQRAYKDIEAEIQKLQLLAKSNQQAADVFTRSYDVASFGWHNWDCIYKTPEKIWVNADFKLATEPIEKQNQIKAYVIAEEGSVVMRYDQQNFDKMSYDPNKETKMIVFLPDGGLATFSAEQFASLGYHPSTTSINHTFEVNKHAKKQADIKTASDLNALIAHL